MKSLNWVTVATVICLVSLGLSSLAMAWENGNTVDKQNWCDSLESGQGSLCAHIYPASPNGFQLDITQANVGLYRDMASWECRSSGWHEVNWKEVEGISAGRINKQCGSGDIFVRGFGAIDDI